MPTDVVSHADVVSRTLFWGVCVCVCGGGGGGRGGYYARRIALRVADGPALRRALQVVPLYLIDTGSPAQPRRILSAYHPQPTD